MELKMDKNLRGFVAIKFVAIKLIATVALLIPVLGVQASILPPNDLYLEDDIDRKDANINEALFNKIIDDISALYRPIIESHGATYTTNNLWNNSTVNASAQQIGNNWIINMYGGLARRPEVTPDGFALVVCHELGHHLAGFPFYGERWAASEGQSDYFATQSCSRKIWADQLDINARYRANVHPIAKAKCDVHWSTESEQNLCYRTAMAGESLARLLGALRKQVPSFETPDKSEVRRTNTAHPQSQCRLDTYFHGALCTAEFDVNLIPGRKNKKGQGSEEAEIEANKNSCSRAAFQIEGVRPLCWYKPKVQSLIRVENLELVEISGDGDAYQEPGETFSLSGKLKNLAKVAYENVSLNLGSDNTEIQTEAQMDILRIEPGAEIDLSGLDFSIRSDAKCGNKVSVNTSLGVGLLSSNSKKSFTIGRFDSAFEKTLTPGIEIPDGDRDGISSEIIVDHKSLVEKAEITVDITHPFSGDITIGLIDPSDKNTKLRNRKGGSKDDIKEVIAIDIPGKAAEGKWTLKVADNSRRDKGVLNKWGIQFFNAVCD